jgi:hypothetical protein
VPGNLLGLDLEVRKYPGRKKDEIMEKTANQPVQLPFL